MPYSWITPPAASEAETASEMHLWPHQSLPPQGYARFIGVTALLITLPLLPFAGSPVFWGLLPFLLLALFGLKYALDRNRRDAQVIEVLTLNATEARLERRNANGTQQSWQCNRYWVKVELHPMDGPVPNYVTLRGSGREVEIGAFLSEDERKALYDELQKAIR
ncbi:DUF2244 domain-containing protein [Pseudophaeobacter sp.]|uniref:DUF2244 domain-containing protein n=1 Tax=Pseudophaeobacter sp. TaxID=1971739 RepID=UPI003296D22B